MLIMDNVYSERLISLGFDPDTFPIIHRIKASSWGSGGVFSEEFAQAPIGLWKNYKGFSNVGKVPKSTIDSITSSTLSTDNIVTATSKIDSTTSTNTNVQVGDSVTDVKASAAVINVNAPSYDTSITTGTSNSVALASNSYSVSVQSDTNVSVDAKLVNKGLTKGFGVSVANIQSSEYTISIV